MLVVSLCGKMFFEELVGKGAYLWETVHPFSDFDVHPSILIYYVAEIVLFDNFFGDDIEFEVHVFGVWHGCVQIEIRQVNAMECYTRGADCRVYQEFCCEEVGCGCALVAWVINAIAPNSESGAMDLIFLWVYVATDAAVCWAFVFWNL